MVLTFEVYVRWCGFGYVELGCLIIVGYWLGVSGGCEFGCFVYGFGGLWLVHSLCRLLWFVVMIQGLLYLLVLRLWWPSVVDLLVGLVCRCFCCLRYVWLWFVVLVFNSVVVLDCISFWLCAIFHVFSYGICDVCSCLWLLVVAVRGL